MGSCVIAAMLSIFGHIRAFPTRIAFLSTSKIFPKQLVIADGNIGIFIAR